MRKLVYRRVAVVSAAIALQLGFLIAGVFWMSEYWRWVRIVLTALSWITAAFVMFDRSNPSYKIAWIVLILAFPVAGLSLYVLFGGNRISRRENRRLEKIRALTAEHLHQDPAQLERLAQQDAAACNHARYLLASSGYPILPCEQADYFSSGESCYEAMLQELEKAERYIFLEYFLIDGGLMWESILQILQRKASAGVTVRVLYDDFGCITRLPPDYPKRLAAMGISARAFNRFQPTLSKRHNNRDHRKLMIIDGRVGFTGGVNLADEYINKIHPYGKWKDCAIRLRGEAVWPMTVMFLSSWCFAENAEEDMETWRPDAFQQEAPTAGWVQSFADSPLDGEDIGAAAYQNLIHSARKRVWIMTPYLILDDGMINTLSVAAKTGIDVRIITPGVPDKKFVHAVTRANYEPLTQAGVRIFEYRPGFLHAKVCLSDDRYAIVGTVNLDFRSLYLHFEDAVYLCSAPVIDAIREDFDAVFPQCVEITYARCRHTYLHQRLMRTLLRMFSPLM